MQIEKPDKEEQLRKADEKIKAAEELGGNMEVRDALLEKSEILLSFGEVDEFVKVVLQALEKTSGTPKRLELYLSIVHANFKHRRFDKFAEYLKTSKTLNEEGGDWEKKNKINVYEGLQSLMRKDFSEAAKIFLGCINTFNAPEIISFEKLVEYSAILGLLTLPRKEIKEKLIANSEIIAVLNEHKVLSNFVFAIFNANYKSFFACLLRLNEEVLAKDEFLQPHASRLVKRACIVTYSQYLESYRTVKLAKMSSDFGVSVEFMDRELSEMIAQKHLSCQIDKVNFVVESSRSESRVAACNELIRKGDFIIERMHKLSKFAYV